MPSSGVLGSRETTAVQSVAVGKGVPVAVQLTGLLTLYTGTALPVYPSHQKCNGRLKMTKNTNA